MSPFTKATLFQVPGDGQTPCRTNCLCYLEREDGRLSMRPITLPPYEAIEEGNAVPAAAEVAPVVHAVPEDAPEPQAPVETPAAPRVPIQRDPEPTPESSIPTLQELESRGGRVTDGNPAIWEYQGQRYFVKKDGKDALIAEQLAGEIAEVAEFDRGDQLWETRIDYENGAIISREIDDAKTFSQVAYDDDNSDGVMGSWLRIPQEQRDRMIIADYLSNNDDRHAMNILVRENGEALDIVLIDNSYRLHPIDIPLKQYWAALPSKLRHYYGRMGTDKAEFITQASIMPFADKAQSLWDAVNRVAIYYRSKTIPEHIKFRILAVASAARFMQSANLFHQLTIRELSDLLDGLFKLIIDKIDKEHRLDLDGAVDQLLDLVWGKIKQNRFAFGDFIAGVNVH